MSDETLYFDAHAHLQLIEDLEPIMHNAQKKGVGQILCNATCENDWQQVMQIASKYHGIHVALGIHPAYVSDLKAGWADRLNTLLAQNKHILVGEIGLDKDKPNIELQESVFRTQLELAHMHQRPAIIHCVKEWGRLFDVLSSQGKIIPPKILSHSHHGDCNRIPEMIKKYNAYFSYSSIFLPENRPKVRACLANTPLDRLLFESDCPDLAAGPASIIDLFGEAQKITGHSISVLQKASVENAKVFVKC